jgi:hypothetical protein
MKHKPDYIEILSNEVNANIRNHAIVAYNNEEIKNKHLMITNTLFIVQSIIPLEIMRDSISFEIKWHEY